MAIRWRSHNVTDVLCVCMCVCVRACVCAGACPCVYVISFSLSHQIFQNTLEVSDFTHHSKRICFKEAERHTFDLINTFLSQMVLALPLGFMQVFAILMH